MTAIAAHLLIFLQLLGAVAFLQPRQTPPDDFTPNPQVGWGGNKWKDTRHFRLYNAPSDSAATSALNSLEAAYTCFVRDLGWRSPGLSFLKGDDNGPFYKLNVYVTNESVTGGAPANTYTEQVYGMSFLNVLPNYVTVPAVTVHEFGHALTYAERYWIDQTVTGAWWETTANFVADTYLNSDHCKKARQELNQPEGDSLVELGKTISESYLTIVDGTRDKGNYYQAWPFLAYVLNNPDNFTGLGRDAFPGVWTKYARNSNETPLHVLQRLAAPTRIQDVVGRYWARMAFVDFGNPKAKAVFERDRAKLNYKNLDSIEGQRRFRPKRDRQPRYMGSNIIPIQATGAVAVNVTASSPFTATLVVKGKSGAVEYIPMKEGSATANAQGNELALVVVNTPDKLLNYDPFKLSPEATRGLDYTVELYAPQGARIEI